MEKENLLLMMLSFLMIMIVGATLNFTVIKSNNCLMPVYSTYTNFNDGSHISFNDFNEVSYPYLSDIIKKNVGNYIFTSSIGDYLMVFGLFSFIISSSFYLKIKHKEKNEI